MLFLPLGLFYKTMGLLDEVNNNNSYNNNHSYSYNNNNSYNLSTINTGCGLVAGGRGTEATVLLFRYSFGVLGGRSAKNVGIQKKPTLCGGLIFFLLTQ